MKKYFGVLLLLVISVFVFTGCEKVNKGEYKEGTYFGSYVDNYGGSETVTTAVVYVDSNGMIKSVFLDNVLYCNIGLGISLKSIIVEYPNRLGNIFVPYKSLYSEPNPCNKQPVLL